MRLADARTLVPDLLTTSVEPQADRRLIETLANWCDRYTPWVAIDPLGAAIAEEGTEACSAGGFGGDAGLLLDVTGCSHLFGKDEKGERALLADLVERLARHDFTCRAAMADTAGAAWALARYAEKQADLFCPRNGNSEQRRRNRRLPNEVAPIKHRTLLKKMRAPLSSAHGWHTRKTARTVTDAILCTYLPLGGNNLEGRFRGVTIFWRITTDNHRPRMTGVSCACENVLTWRISPRAA